MENPVIEYGPAAEWLISRTNLVSILNSLEHIKKLGHFGDKYQYICLLNACKKDFSGNYRRLMALKTITRHKPDHLLNEHVKDFWDIYTGLMKSVNDWNPNN